VNIPQAIFTLATFSIHPSMKICLKETRNQEVSCCRSFQNIHTASPLSA